MAGRHWFGNQSWNRRAILARDLHFTAAPHVGLDAARLLADRSCVRISGDPSCEAGEGGFRVADDDRRQWDCFGGLFCPAGVSRCPSILFIDAVIARRDRVTHTYSATRTGRKDSVYCLLDREDEQRQAFHVPARTR